MSDEFIIKYDSSNNQREFERLFNANIPSALDKTKLNNFKLIGAYDGKTLAGGLAYQVITDDKYIELKFNKRITFIELSYLAVKENYRKKNCAKKLIELSKERESATDLIITSHVADNLIDFYKKLGFTQIITKGPEVNNTIRINEEKMREIINKLNTQMYQIVSFLNPYGISYSPKNKLLTIYKWGEMKHNYLYLINNGIKLTYILEDSWNRNEPNRQKFREIIKTYTN